MLVSMLAAALLMMLAILSFGASAQARRSSCSGSSARRDGVNRIAARAKGARHACTHAGRKHHKHHVKRHHPHKAKVKPPAAASQVPASCEDGSKPLRAVSKVAARDCDTVMPH